MYDFKKIEEEMLEFWKKKKIYQKAVSKNKKGKEFYFLQGPPYTSGRLHIGHAWNNSLKDIAMRYFRFKGMNVWDRAGYDMHGLPTANKVQKEFKLKDKESIIEFGVDKFVKRCQEFSLENSKLMNKDLKRLGIWMDFENAYLPVKNEFMSSEWLLIKKAHEQGRLYKGKKIMHWCGECETSLAKHELEYENVKDNSIFLKFKVEDKEEYLVIWTTTPWTIPYNLAVMVNPKIDYVKAEVETEKGKEKWIVAKALAGAFIAGVMGYKFKVLEEFKGKALDGVRYVHPFYSELKEVYDALRKKSDRVHSVILSKEYVDTSAGSGLVHSAPGCGPEDYEACKKYGIDAFNNVNEQGIFENMTKFSGLKAKKDDAKFIEMLKENGSLLKQVPVEHEYAHCWRCHKPVIFRTTEQWFLKTEDLVKKILDYNKKINWVPKKVKNSYEAWISNLKDNGITRQRFWGTPAPIWECECGETIVIGSQEELEKKSKTQLPKNLHKPWIDEVLIKCPKCKKDIKRVPDILDVWIDSGTVSWNCLDYPKEKKYFEEFFPADLILEASEQARLWFSMLQLCSTIVFGKSCYKGVFGHGMILDFQGTKMSKSLGNIISPYEVIDKYSSEILRYYICQTKAGENINFNWEDVKQKQRNLIVLLNTANYLIQLKSDKTKKGGVEEKYVLSLLNSSIEKTTELFETYNFDKTITEIEKLFLDISRKYIKLTRDKENEIVYSILKDSYVKTLKMFSTICPLFCEYLWQRLKKEKIVKEDSVHLSSWPKVDKKKINKKLELDFEDLLKIVEVGLAQRDKVQIGLKWPLAKAIILGGDFKLNKEMQEIIKSQLNVKDLEFKESKANEKDISVELDTKMNPELEAEGYARNIIRGIQAFRKKLGLTPNQEVKTILVVDKKLKEMLDKHKNTVADKTNSKDLDVVTESKETFKNANDFKVKDKKIVIIINH